MKISCVCQNDNSNQLKATKYFRNLPRYIRKDEWFEKIGGNIVYNPDLESNYIDIDIVKPDLVCVIDSIEKTVSSRWEPHTAKTYETGYDNVFDNIIDMDKFVDNVFFSFDPSNSDEVKFIYDTSAKIMPISMLISHLEGVKPDKTSSAETSIDFSEQLLKSLKMRMHNKVLRKSRAESVEDEEDKSENNVNNSGE